MDQERKNQNNKKPMVILIGVLLVVGIIVVGLAWYEEGHSILQGGEMDNGEVKVLEGGEKTVENNVNVGEGGEVVEEVDTSDPSSGSSAEVLTEEEALVEAGWLTYRNEEYGFEFKYPEGWCVEGYNCGLSRDKKNIYVKLIHYDKLTEVSEFQGPGINNKNDFEKSYENFRQSSGLIDINNLKVSIGYNYDVPSAFLYKKIAFFPSSKQKVVIYTGIFPDSDQVYIWHEDKEVILQILEDLKDDTIYPEEVKIFDQIISTLKKI